MIEMYRYLQKVISSESGSVSIGTDQRGSGSVPKCHRIRNTVHYMCFCCRRSPQEDYSESESDWGEEDEGGGRTAAARRPPPRKQTKPKVRCSVADP